MDSNVRTRRRGKRGAGSEDENIIGAYGRDGVDDNGVLSFYSTTKGDVSHTFNGRGQKRASKPHYAFSSIDYIVARQRDRKLVRNVTVHPESSFAFTASVSPRQAHRPFCFNRRSRTSL